MMVQSGSQPATYAARALDFLRLVRPRQTIKNAVCFAGVLFGPGRLNQPDAWLLDLLAATVFCIASAAMYIFNDIYDQEHDRIHPSKRLRPIAAGRIGVGEGAVLAAFLAALAIAIAAKVSVPMLLVLLAYLANTAVYTVWTKHIPIWDVVAIAMGFLLRLLAGIYVLGDTPTAWIVLCVFFLCTLMATCKRRGELVLMQANGAAGGASAASQGHRPVLSVYNLAFLDGMMNSTAVMTMVSYAMFTTLSHKNPTLVVTVPIVFVGIMHFKRLVLFDGKGEEPEQIFLHDRPTQAIVLAWLALYELIVHMQTELVR